MDAVARYLNLMKRVLTRTGFNDGSIEPWSVREVRVTNWKRHLVVPTQRVLAQRGYRIVEQGRSSREAAAIRNEGGDWPEDAETMIGLQRLDNVQYCVETVLAEEVPGDLIETGVWRGGASIFMRAVLAAHEVKDRIVWVADSFQGLPKPDVDRYPADEGDIHSTYRQLAVSADDVRKNFQKYDLLDEQVRFLEGWFSDTLAAAPIDALAVARLDGDMYGSTWDAITVLYPKLSTGGFLIVDDYALGPCQQAIEDYREGNGIREPVVRIDAMGAYWRKLG